MKFGQIACAIALSLCASAQAAPVTYEFAGVIDSSAIEGFDVSMPISGTISWDADTAPINGPISLGDGVQFANYIVDEPGAFSMSVGGMSITTPQLLITLLDTSSPADGPEGLSIMANAVSLNGEPTDSALVQFTLQTPGTRDTLSIGLPSAVTLDDFQAPDTPASGYFSTSADSDALSFYFQVTSFKPVTSAVPEASTTASLALGLLAMAGAVRQARRKQAAR